MLIHFFILLFQRIPFFDILFKLWILLMHETEKSIRSAADFSLSLFAFQNPLSLHFLLSPLPHELYCTNHDRCCHLYLGSSSTEYKAECLFSLELQNNQISYLIVKLSKANFLHIEIKWINWLTTLLF